MLDPDSAVGTILKLEGPPYYHLAEEHADQDRLLAGGFVHAEGIKAAIGVQLRVGERKVGVMFVNFRSPHRFTSDEIATIQLFADQAAVAIENARLYKREEYRAREAEAMVQVGQAISSTLDLNRILQTVAQSALLLLGLELEDMGEISLKSNKKIQISNLCTIFAQQEVVSHLSEGENLEDIIAGLHDALTSRVAALARRLKVEPDVVLTGGVAKNIGIVKAMKENLGCALLVPEEPLLTGAIGAATLAKEIYTKAMAEGEPIPTTTLMEGGQLRNGMGEEILGRHGLKADPSLQKDALSRALYSEIVEGRGAEHGGIWLMTDGYVIANLHRSSRVYHGVVLHHGITANLDTGEISPDYGAGENPGTLTNLDITDDIGGFADKGGFGHPRRFPVKASNHYLLRPPILTTYPACSQATRPALS